MTSTVVVFGVLLVVTLVIGEDHLASSQHGDENNDGLEDRYDLNRDGKPDDGHAVGQYSNKYDHQGQGHGKVDGLYGQVGYNRYYGQGYNRPHKHTGSYEQSYNRVHEHTGSYGQGYNKVQEHTGSYPHQRQGYEGKEHETYGYGHDTYGYGYNSLSRDHGLREPVHYGGNPGGYELKESHGGLGYNLGETQSPYRSHGYGGIHEQDHRIYGIAGYRQHADLGYRSGYEHGVQGQFYGSPHQYQTHHQARPYEFEAYRFQ